MFKMAKKFIWSKILYGDDGHDFHYAYYGGEELGYLEYHKPWKKWVWNQNEDIILGLSCLDNVCKKIYALEVKDELN